MTVYDKPLAAPPSESYRYRGRYGFIMIGALGTAEALSEVRRSTDGPVTIDNLEKWSGTQYTATGAA
jgi:hypothetical protein